MERLSSINQQFLSKNDVVGKGNYAEQRSKHKLDWFKDNGWGFKDTEFVMDPDGQVRLTGKR